MSDFGVILGFVLIATVLLLLLRKERPEIAALLCVAVAAIVMSALLKKIEEVIVILEAMAAKARINREYLALIVKIIGLAYLAGFGAQICQDAGESSMAAKIELAGKVFILSMGIPVMAGLFELIFKVL